MVSTIFSIINYVNLKTAIIYFDLSINVCRTKLKTNVFGLCEEAELEAPMFSLVQMLIRIPNVQFSTEPAFLQNPC
jgi:hypothetical protein